MIINVIQTAYVFIRAEKKSASSSSFSPGTDFLRLINWTGNWFKMILLLLPYFVYLIDPSDFFRSPEPHSCIQFYLFTFFRALFPLLCQLAVWLISLFRGSTVENMSNRYFYEKYLHNLFHNYMVWWASAELSFCRWHKRKLLSHTNASTTVYNVSQCTTQKYSFWVSTVTHQK